MIEDEKPPRDPTAKCPDCQCDWLYTDYYDKCYKCGRNVEETGRPQEPERD